MATPKNAAWTIMIYMNVEPEGFDEGFRKNHLEMSLIGSNENVHIIIIVDRNASKKNITAEEKHKQFLFPSIYRIEKGVEIKPDTVPLIEIKNENLGSPVVLEQFLTHCIKHFPAEKYMLSFWDHGAGNAVTTSPSEEVENFMNSFLGENFLNESFKNDTLSFFESFRKKRRFERNPVGTTFNFPIRANRKEQQEGNRNFNLAIKEDDQHEAEQDYLYPKEICRAIENSFGKNKKIDIIAFDACWMQMFENAYTLKNCANYMVASENLISLQGFGYYMFLKYLTQKPSVSSLEAAILLIKSCYLKIPDTVDAKTAEELVKLYYQKIYDEPKMTLSCINLNATDSLAEKINRLSEFLETNLQNLFEYIRNARFLCLSYFDEEDPSDYDLKVIDLVYFLKKLTEIAIQALKDKEPKDPDIYTPIIQVSNEIAEIAEMNFVVYKEMGTDMREEKETDKRWGTHGFSIFFPEHVFEWEIYKETEGWYFEKNEDIQMPFALENKWKNFLDKYFKILATSI